MLRFTHLTRGAAWSNRGAVFEVEARNIHALLQAKCLEMPVDIA
jgi:hypothetical protein